jgi:hypothetical protein
VPRSQRTEWNVRDSDATLVIQSAGASHSEAATEDEQQDPGTKWTVQCAARYKRPVLVCNVSDANPKEKIQQWLAALPINTLNVAGPSEATSPGIGARVYTLLRQAFKSDE